LRIQYFPGLTVPATTRRWDWVKNVNSGCDRMIAGNRILRNPSQPPTFTMKIRILLLSAVLAFPLTFAVRAEGPKKPAQEETELEGKMEKMGQAWKKLKRQVTDASKNADSLQLVATIRASAEEAVKLTPAKAADIPEAERAKFVADFRADMKEFLTELGKLDAALKADQNVEAAKLLAKIGAMQKAAHKEFKRPEEK